MLQTVLTFVTVFPSTVWAILITETAERFAYYGFRAILILYLTEQLRYEDETAICYFAYMTSLAYTTPIVGAVLSDAYMGKYRTIAVFVWIYSLGLIMLAFSAYGLLSENYKQERKLSLVSLVLICIGTGGIKPCVSPFGADQLLYDSSADEEEGDGKGSSLSTDVSNTAGYSGLATSPSLSNNIHDAHDHDDSSDDFYSSSPSSQDVISSREGLAQKFFAWYYVGINIGSLASFLIIPVIKAQYGFGTAFVVPAIFIVVALMVFCSKSHEYIIFTPTRQPRGETRTGLTNVLRVYYYFLKRKCSGRFYFRRAYDVAATSSVHSVSSNDKEDILSQQSPHVNGISQEQYRDAVEVLRIFPVLALYCLFWMLYDQQGSVWVLQAKHMDLHGIQPEQLGIVNPLLITFLVPVFDSHIYPLCRRYGVSTDHLSRIGTGIILCSVSFFMSGLLERSVDIAYHGKDYDEGSAEDDGDDHNSTGTKLNVLWQLPQIFVLSMAEILVSVTGLEFAYTFSPSSMKSVVMAALLLTTAIGDMLGGILYSSLSGLRRDYILHICGFLMLFNFVAFKKVKIWWEQSDSFNNNQERVIR